MTDHSQTVLTVERLAEIRALAKAATAGPWERGSGSATVWAKGSRLHVAECETTEIGLPPTETMQAVANADYLAALPPEVVLALVREALAGRAAIDAWEALDAAVAPNRPATGEPGSAWFRRMDDLATAARALSREYHAALAGPGAS